ncbi:MAG: flagellar biosynthetic protein FliR [bacterium]|nr:flagellar biosynthetic protein FliR [bacterium]
MKLDQFSLEVLNNLDVIWTFLLLMCRYFGLFIVLPGIGYGLGGMRIRAPAMFALSLAAMPMTKIAPLPENILIIAAMTGGEFIFGYILGVIPMLIVEGVKAGAQLATNTMGLSAANMFDPATGTTSTDLARLQGDLIILVFLLLGGHYIVIEAVSGLSGSFTPGLFVFDGFTSSFLINQLAKVFESAVMISAPVVMALLLTQFVMGLISKAIPSVNIFIVSFPLTVGIGLLFTILALPEVVRYVVQEMSSLDNMLSVVIENMTDIK